MSRSNTPIFLAMSALVFAVGTGSGEAANCAMGAPFPISGLCEEEAKKLMPPINADYESGLKLMGCKPVLQEIMAMGRPLLYYGADCGNGPVQLQAAAGARSGSLTKIGGGMDTSNNQPVDLVTFLFHDAANPTASLVKWARDSMISEGVYQASDIDKCKARKVAGTHDIWVVDEFTNDTLPVSADGPRFACGLYGYTEDSDAKWRVAHGFSWFADFGQDAYKDIDFTSFTLLPSGDTAAMPSQALPSTPIAPVTDNAQPIQSTPAQNVQNFGVNNIAGADEQPYGDARGWTVYAGKQGGQFVYCAGERDYDDVKLRLGWDGSQWQLAVPFSVRPDYYGQFEVDGTKLDMSGTSDANWTYAWIGEQELQAIRNGNLMILDIARASLDFPLIGTAATILKVQECVERSR